MRRRGSNNGRDERYSKTLKFGTAVNAAIEASRLSRRRAGEMIERDGSTIAGWCKGRTLPESDRDIENVAQLLGLDVELLSCFADYDEAAYQVRGSTMSVQTKAETLKRLDNDLATFLVSQKRATAAAG